MILQTNVKVTRQTSPELRRRLGQKLREVESLLFQIDKENTFTQVYEIDEDFDCRWVRRVDLFADFIEVEFGALPMFGKFSEQDTSPIITLLSPARIKVMLNPLIKSEDITLLSNPRDGVEAYINNAWHPHQMPSGNFCFGNVGDELSARMNDTSIEELIFTLIRFFSSFNPSDSAGAHGWKWFNRQDIIYKASKNKSADHAYLEMAARTATRINRGFGPSSMPRESVYNAPKTSTLVKFLRHSNAATRRSTQIVNHIS